MRDSKNKIIIILLMLFVSTIMVAAGDQLEENLQSADRLFKEGKFKEALEAYQEIVKIDEKCAIGYERLTFLYMSAGKEDDAFNAAQRAIGLNPECSIPYNILGIIEEHRKNYRLAEDYYKKATENDPHYARAYSNLGNIHVRNGDYERGEGTYRKAIEMDPGFGMGHNNLAYALEMQGKLGEAQSEYEKALELDRSNEMARNNLSRLKEKLSQPAATSDDQKIALEICRFTIPEGFRLVKAVSPTEGGKLAIFEYNFIQRLILRELPPDNPINETVFAQMIVEYKKELITLLEDLLKAKNIRIKGQGYVDIESRKVLYISTEFEDGGNPMEGTFSLVTNSKKNSNILIMAVAQKGIYRRDITESFLKTLRIERQ